MSTPVRPFRMGALAALALSLSGCNAVVLDPSGDVAAQQRDLLIQSTGLMLLIILPVMALTAFFAWRYRHTNKSAPYEPDWDHSTQLELVIWGAPLLIIICLGALTWVGTHLLDPYRPLSRVDSTRTVGSDTKPLEVEVVALDWKWLFIYPQYGVATVNEIAAPVDRPISFRITASSVMNSFYIPALAGQIYAMPGMETKLHAVINKPGSYTGFSANYSGSGFSGMHFAFLGLDSAGFDKWVSDIRQHGGALGRAEYLELEKPSENVPVRTYASVDGALYKAILNMCVQPGKMCIDEMAAIDAKGGLGLAGVRNVLPLDYDKYVRRGLGIDTALGPKPTAIGSLCTVEESDARSIGTLEATPAGISLPVKGEGLARPPYSPVGLLRFELLTGARPSKS